MTLEICPTSNLLTKALRDEDEVRETFRRFAEHGVPFTIATDGPEMMRTHLRDEFALLLRIGALDEDELGRRTSEATPPRSSARSAPGGCASSEGRSGGSGVRDGVLRALGDVRAVSPVGRHRSRVARLARAAELVLRAPATSSSAARAVSFVCRAPVEESHGEPTRLLVLGQTGSRLSPARVEVSRSRSSRLLVGLLDRVVVPAAGRVVELVLDLVDRVTRRSRRGPSCPRRGRRAADGSTVPSFSRSRCTLALDLVATPRSGSGRPLWIVYLVWGSTYLAIKVAVGPCRRCSRPGRGSSPRRRPRRHSRAAALAPRQAAGSALRGGPRGRAARVRRRPRARRGDAHRLGRRGDDRRLRAAPDRRLAARRRRARAAADGARRASSASSGSRSSSGPRGFAGGATAVGLARDARRLDLAGRAARSSSRRLRCRPTRSSRPSTRCSAAGSCSSSAAVAAGELGRLDRDAFEPGPVAAWAYLASSGSVLGFSAYVWLLDNAPISQVVTHQYVNPLVAVALGALLLDERPGPATLAGAALIVGAVVVTARREGTPTGAV